MIFQKSNENARRSYRCVIEGVDKELLAGAIAIFQAESARLKVMKTGARMGLAISIAAGHPGFDVVFAHLAQSHFTGADCHYSVGQLQCLQDVFGIFKQSLVLGQRSLIVVGADNNLLDLLKLVHPVETFYIAPSRSPPPS